MIPATIPAMIPVSRLNPNQPAASGKTSDRDPLDRERLQGVLKELLECRQMLDRVLKDG